MKTSTKKIGLLLTALLISFNSVAESKQLRLKLAVVEYATGSKEIIKGDYAHGLKKLEKAQSTERVKFDIATGLCAAKVMTREFEKAKPFCNQAIDVYKGRTSSKYHYLTSIAYSNRGVVRFKLGDAIGAEDDLKLAASIDENSIVKSNLDFLRMHLNANVSHSLQVASE